MDGGSSTSRRILEDELEAACSELSHEGAGDNLRSQSEMIITYPVSTHDKGCPNPRGQGWDEDRLPSTRVLEHESRDSIRFEHTESTEIGDSEGDLMKTTEQLLEEKAGRSKSSEASKRGVHLERAADASRSESAGAIGHTAASSNEQPPYGQDEAKNGYGEGSVLRAPLEGEPVLGPCAVWVPGSPDFSKATRLANEAKHSPRRRAPPDSLAEVRLAKLHCREGLPGSPLCGPQAWLPENRAATTRKRPEDQGQQDGGVNDSIAASRERCSCKLAACYVGGESANRRRQQRCAMRERHDNNLRGFERAAKGNDHIENGAGDPGLVRGDVGEGEGGDGTENRVSEFLGPSSVNQPGLARPEDRNRKQVYGAEDGSDERASGRHSDERADGAAARNGANETDSNACSVSGALRSAEPVGAEERSALKRKSALRKQREGGDEACSSKDCIAKKRLRGKQGDPGDRSTKSHR